MKKTSVWKPICFLGSFCMSSFTVYAASKGSDACVNGNARIRIEQAPLTNKVVISYQLYDYQQLRDSLLTEYSGTFDFTDFPSLEIYLSNGNLYAETSQGKSILKKLDAKDTFDIVDYQARLKFNRNGTGSIISVELDAHGFTSTGLKRKRID